MPPRRTLSTRWVSAVLAAALVCSVAVVWSLIQLTGGTSASSSTPPGSASGSTSSNAPANSAASTAAPTHATDPADPTSGHETPGREKTSPASSSGLTGTQRSGLSTTSNATATALPGSDLTLPAAWTGTAELTITVLGQCGKAVGASSYTREAELALQRPAAGSGPIGDANPLSLTLGITPADVPGLSLYSASTGGDGEVRRTWWLATGAATPKQLSGRTELSGVLIDDQPVNGVLPPNLLLDNETDLQPCETSGTVRVPRILAAGSTLTGWVSATAGHLDLKATTTDGERSLAAVITLSRRSGT